MPSEPEIPFGYKRVHGEVERGDGVWRSDINKFVKVRKEYPFAGTDGRVFIRRCTITQPELPNVDAADNNG
jgi:hypothetical protein